MRHALGIALFTGVLLAATQGLAEAQEYKISIKDHRFNPDKIEIPAQTKVKLKIKNEDATPEEFESHDLNREKIIPGHSEVTVWIGPLAAGEYKFFGEFNPKTAQGILIAK